MGHIKLFYPRFLAQRIAKPPLSDLLTWLGLLCMGLGSSLFVLTLLREFALLVAQVIDWVWPFPMASLRVDSALLLPILGILITLWGYWNARRTVAVVRIDVPIANLPIALQGFNVAQISDIHVGPTIKGGYLSRIVERVNSLGADLVAITGDLVDGSVHELRDQIAPLTKLVSRHGTFFVTGNHEYYSGAHVWIEVLRALGVQALMNEHVVIHHNADAQDPEQAMVVVAGVTDFSAHRFDETHRSNPELAMSGAPVHAIFKLLLAHQPRSAPAAMLAGFDLQLSGHTYVG